MNAPSTRVYPTAKITSTTTVLMGKNSVIGDYTFIHLKRLEMGENCYIHPFTAIIGGGELHMHDNVSIGYHCFIATATDTWKSGKHMSSALPEEQRDVVRGKIILCKDVFIGPYVTIVVSKEHPTIEIGEGAVIGAYSYIDKPVSPYTVIVPRKDCSCYVRRLADE
jgi:acetyltransferase-like isoleucine patch superfamily enzyme